MKVLQLWILVLASLLTGNLIAQAPSTVPASVGAFKLLTATSGWASNSNTLFITNDGGATWQDITPPSVKGPLNRWTLDSVFFNDPSSGWALVDHQSGPESDDYAFAISATTDGGQTWSTAQVPLDVRENFAGGGISFSDRLHGWLDLGRQSSAAFQLGELFSTSDGGQTWALVPGAPPHSGLILPLSNGNGWLVALSGHELYGSLDGGKSFKEVSLQPPSGTSGPFNAVYDLPVFLDSVTGYEAVTYTGPNLPNPFAILFATNDGGVTWKADRTVNGLDPGAFGDVLPSTIADSTWIIPVAPQGSKPVLKEVDAGYTLNAGPNMRNLGAPELSFISPGVGWVLCSLGLLSTTDGGATWKDVTPRVPGVAPKPGALRMRSDAPVKTSSTMGAVPLASPFSAGVQVSQHLGFDKAFVAAAPVMETWWQSSPYYDVGIYLNGTAAQGHSHAWDNNLTSTWVSTVHGYGWGLIPIWSGPQAPCACDGGGTYPTCAPFPHTFSSNPSQAQAAGTTQADYAISSAQGIGLSGSIIYVDIESYDSSKCGPAVQAYVSGWVNEMHLKTVEPAAGVYGNPAGAASDFAAADNVWVALWDHKVTVWNMTGLNDSPWPNFQRIKQYYGKAPPGYFETWGGQRLNVDLDVEDGPLYAGSGAKTYSTLTPQLISYSGSSSGSWLTTINNGTHPQPAGLFQQNDLVGIYEDPTSPYYTHAFLSQAGGPDNAFTYPVSQVFITYPNGINNAGQIVGYYGYLGDVNGNGDQILHGFTYNSGNGSYATVDAPDGLSGLGSMLGGINDAGWIVGTWTDSSWNHHCFLDKGGTFTSFDGPGQSDTVCTGINGLGQIVGYYGLTGVGFLDDAEAGDPSIPANFTTISGPGGSSATPTGINNNGAISGSGSSAFFIQGGVLTSFLVDCSTQAYGLNDDLQIVGLSEPCGGGSQGFVLTPSY